MMIWLSMESVSKLRPTRRMVNSGSPFSSCTGDVTMFRRFETLYMKIGFALFSGLFAAILMLAGCQSSIVPLQPSEVGPPWALPVTEAPTTFPSTSPSTTVSASSDWLVNPENSIVQTIAPETYDHIWQQSLNLISSMGYHINWQDYRLGVITTDPRIGPQIIEFLRPDATDAESMMESTINTFRRSIRLTITPGSTPQSWRVSVEVLVEKRENPLGNPGNIAYGGTTAFGANVLPLENGYTPGESVQQYWSLVGRDPKLEKKIIDELFQTL